MNCCQAPDVCKKLGGCIAKMKGYNENVSRLAPSIIDVVPPKQKSVVKGIPKN